jgi:DNA modification methylase
VSEFEIRQGDALTLLRAMPAESVQCCVTSPPYWGLRDYGVAGQLGLEPTPEAYVAAMVEVFREVRRVLRDDGTLWLNLGDSYAGAGTIGRNDTTPEALARRAEKYGTGTGAGSAVGAQGTRGRVETLKSKDLVGIPWRVAFALQTDGWWLRSDVIWHKPNPMPESVTDRPTKAHEYLFLMAKSERYYYDADAIKTVSERAGEICGTGPKSLSRGSAAGAKVNPSGNAKAGGCVISPERSNKRTVWSIATMPYADAHFAVMPQALVEPCVLAGSRPGDLVLDPFSGSGTVGVVSLRHGRRFVGLELNPAYVEMARRRIAGPLFSGATA